MARASRADAAAHHEELIAAASRLFRERGAEAVSVPDVMGAIGLTRGGFYKHFESKEALVCAAVDAAYDQHERRLADCADGRDHDPAGTRTAFLDFCVSTGNRDDAGDGCPSPFVVDMARTGAGAPSRETYLRRTRALVDALREHTTDPDADPAERDEALLADLATTVGAVLLARATAGDPLSDEILHAARRRLG
jgi:TetR/AcrR family transcriptional regulator, transcriptional repressor for nem operon